MTSTSDYTVYTTLYECDDCGERSAPTFHDCHPSKPPVIYVDSEWICARCGVPITPTTSCFNCGNGTEVSRMKVSLDLGPREAIQNIEKKIHSEINSRRRSEGYDTVEWDSHLSMIALAHSRDMATRSYFSHTSPEGVSAGERAEQYNYGYRRFSENISYRTVNPAISAKAVAEDIVNSWMDSSGHRKNIIDLQVTHHGVGCYVDGGQIYVTENFACPRP